ncbi:MAG: hypothetical protein JXR25_14525 [Pontiellaceae bacterium]|nr:hypothetical protein [Pontiellaceae bacterium]MBN2786035.1 hypothetical protein [Pontiellaceae bacterium]
MQVGKIKSIFLQVARPVVLLGATAVCCMPQSVNAEDGHWTTTWATAVEDIRSGFWMADGYFPPKPLAQNTCRMFVRTSVGGELVRFRFSNAYGTSPVTINSAHFALAADTDSSATDGDINTDTDTTLKFCGVPGTVIPPGGVVYSDPVKFNLSPLSLVAISIQYGKIADDPVSGHRGSRTTSFFADGKAVSASDMTGAVKKDVWYTLTGIEVMAPMSSKTVIAMGDSITDGNGTLYNYHTRWTDFLATRLAGNAPTEGIGVANMGIGGSGAGMALDRLKRDVLDQGAARWMVIFIGVNDIVYGNAQASSLISSYTDMANQAHAAGLKVYGATITPMGNAANASQKAVRQDVNTWIRTTALSSGIFDGCIDFDATMRDPSNPEFTLPAYRKDDLHMNPTGYEAMADSIDLSLFVDP